MSCPEHYHANSHSVLVQEKGGAGWIAFFFKTAKQTYTCSWAEVGRESGRSKRKYGLLGMAHVVRFRRRCLNSATGSILEMRFDSTNTRAT
jgi:hypothetical protein